MDKKIETRTALKCCYLYRSCRMLLFVDLIHFVQVDFPNTLISEYVIYL